MIFRIGLGLPGNEQNRMMEAFAGLVYKTLDIKGVSHISLPAVVRLRFLCSNVSPEPYRQKGYYNTMKKTVAQITLLLLLLAFSVMAVVLVRHVLQLPFGPTNDNLHKKGSVFTLDRFIPAGTYIDSTMTIQDVITIRLQQETSTFRPALKALSDLIPFRYRLLLDLVQFFFWTFLWMTFFRVFTFMGYGRALRTSLLMGGIIYYYMPDFSPEKMDDAVFLSIPILIILIRRYWGGRSKAGTNWGLPLLSPVLHAVPSQIPSNFHDL